VANEITILSACLYVSPNNFKPITKFYEIQCKSHAIEGDLDAIISNLVVSRIPKLCTFKLLSWMQNLHQST
jgi:hypothetical protein